MTLRQSTNVFIHKLNQSNAKAVFWYKGLVVSELVDKLRTVSAEDARQIVSDQEALGNIVLKKRSSANWKLFFIKILKRVL